MGYFRGSEFDLIVVFARKKFIYKIVFIMIKFNLFVKVKMQAEGLLTVIILYCIYSYKNFLTYNLFHTI